MYSDKLVSQGNSTSKTRIKALTKLPTPVPRGSPNQAVKMPPRLVSDQLITRVGVIESRSTLYDYTES